MPKQKKNRRVDSKKSTFLDGSDKQEKKSDLNQEWHRSLDAIPEMVSIQDAHFRLIKVNQAYAKAVGMKKSELVGKKCFEVKHGKMNPVANCPYVHTRATKRSATREHFEPHLRKHFETSTSPIFDENKNLLGVIHVSKDITKRKELERKLKNSRDELEKTVQLRTAQLQKTNEQLREKIKAHQKAQKDLIELYRHVGITNRRISVFLRLNGVKASKSKDNKEKIKEIMILANEISNADSCAFFNLDDKNKRFDLFSVGIDGKTKRDRRNVSVFSHDLLKELVKKKKRIEANVEKTERRNLCLGSGVKKVVLLPMIANRGIRWALLLGFKKEKSISAQDLDLYDAFSMQASIVLSDADKI